MSACVCKYDHSEKITKELRNILFLMYFLYLFTMKYTHMGRVFSTLFYSLVYRFWMMSFERFNKFIKDLCFNPRWPMSSVAAAYMGRAAAHYRVIT